MAKISGTGWGNSFYEYETGPFIPAPLLTYSLVPGPGLGMSLGTDLQGCVALRLRETHQNLEWMTEVDRLLIT